MHQESSSPTDPNAVGRLAPSPTGALHLGNARSFLLAWLSARQQSGRVYLRIEDIDSPRVKPDTIQKTIDDLHWLGLDWDASELQSSHDIPLLQTTRLDRYIEILEQLKADQRIYRCDCSRKDVALAASAPHDGNLPALEGDIYPGTCRQKTKAHLPEAQRHCWRWLFDEGTIEWDDHFLGAQSAHPAAQLGDFVIAKSMDEQITPAYQLAVVVDDYEQGITEVVRGDDLVFSTYRQLAILSHLGWPTPHYFHVPLVLGPDGKRLAKRHGDTRVSLFRETGIKAEAIIGYLAFTLGLQTELVPLTASELIGRLDWDKLPQAPTVFNLEQDFPTLKQMS